MSFRDRRNIYVFFLATGKSFFTAFQAQKRLRKEQQLIAAITYTLTGTNLLHGHYSSRKRNYKHNLQETYNSIPVEVYLSLIWSSQTSHLATSHLLLAGLLAHDVRRPIQGVPHLAPQAPLRLRIEKLVQEMDGWIDATCQRCVCLITGLDHNIISF